MAVISTLNQLIQIGVESTPGVPPGSGSNRLLRHLTYKIDPDFQYQMYRGAGRRFNSVQTLKMEKAKYVVGGPITYTELAYPMSGLWGTPVVTTPTNGVLARQLTWSPLVTGKQNGVTYQGQNGETASRVRAFNYMTQQGLELTMKRSGDSVISGGAGIAQQVQQNSAFTVSPTTQLALPVPPVHWNVYLDVTSAAIGTTLVAQGVEVQWKTSGWNADIWFLVRSNASFGATVDTPPTTTCLIRLMPDSVVDNFWIAARANQTCYIRLDGLGLPVDNQYTLNGSASYTSGSFTLTYKGQTTTAIAFNALGSAIQSALTALTTVGTGNATVTPAGTAFNTATTFTVSFSGPLANDPTVLTANFGSLVGGTPALTNISVYNELRFDMAAKYVPSTYADDGGGWIQDFLFEIVEDPTWTLAGAGGTALYAFLVNNMSGL